LLRERAGWRAAEAGRKRSGSVFDQPQRLNDHPVLLKKRDRSDPEFVLRWSAMAELFREIVRQQWNFSPPETIREVEEYQVELASVAVLELVIVRREWRKRSRLAQLFPPVLKRDQVSRASRKTARREFSRRAAVDSVREVRRFQPGPLGPL